MTVTSRIKAVIAREGISVIYKQITDQSVDTATMKKSNIYNSVTIKAHFRKFAQKEVTGLVKEGDRQMRIAADALGFSPKTNDIILQGVDTFKIVTVDTRVAHGTAAIHICVVRGGE